MPNFKIRGMANFDGSEVVTGAIAITGSLGVGGATNFSGVSTVTGAQIVSGSLNVAGSSVLTGSAALQGGAVVTGSVSVSSSLLVSGCTSLAGGAVVTGSMSVSSSALVTGSTALAGGTKIGTVGTKVTSLVYGSVVFAVPQFTASGIGVAVDSPTVANLPAGAKIWLQPTGSCGIFVSSAYVSAASVISASFHIGDHAATGGTCNITCNYLAVV